VAGARRSMEKEAFWRGVLRRQQASGFSVRGFCQGEGVSVASFYAWRRKIVERDSQRGEAANDRQQNLVPVEVISDEVISPSRPVTMASNMLEIVTPEGLTLRFDDRTRPETIAALVDIIAPNPERRASC
jgi:hypothetical protein